MTISGEVNEGDGQSSFECTCGSKLTSGAIGVLVSAMEHRVTNQRKIQDHSITVLLKCSSRFAGTLAKYLAHNSGILGKVAGIDEFIIKWE